MPRGVPKAGMRATSTRRAPKGKDFDKVVAKMFQGFSARAACRQLGLHEALFHHGVRASPDLAQQYARAREVQGEMRGDEGDEIKAAVLSGLIGEREGTLALAWIKWTGGQMAPSTWNRRPPPQADDSDDDGGQTITVNIIGGLPK